MHRRKWLQSVLTLAACLLLALFGRGLTQAAPAPTPPVWVRGFILPAAAIVRAGPEASSPALGNLLGGEGVQVIGRTAAGDWLQIIHPPESDGKGWLPAKAVETFGLALTLPVVPGDAKPAVGPTPQAAAPQPLAAQPSGKLALQTASGGDIYLVQADGSSLRRLTDGLDPSLSPDGRFVAFARWREPMGLYVLDLTTGEERRLFAGNRVRTPAWSPNGKAIIFSHEVGGKPAQEVCLPFIGCFQVPAQVFRRLGQVWLTDGRFQDIPSDLYSISPTWSPAGDRFAYRGDRGIRLAEPAGKTSWLLEDARATSPAWSPDGQRLAIQLYQHDHWELFLLNPADGRLTPLTRASASRAANNVAPAWSPDGKYIAFLTDRGGRWELYVMNADGSGQRPFFQHGLPGLTFRYDFAAERMISWSE